MGSPVILSADSPQLQALEARGATDPIGSAAATLLREILASQSVGTIVFDPKRNAPQVEWSADVPIRNGARLYAGHPVVEPEGDLISIQAAWEAAGGNPGIKPTKQDLIEALGMLDRVCEEADRATPAPLARLPLSDEGIEAATGTKRGQPMWLVAVGFTRAIEAAHGIVEPSLAPTDKEPF